MLVAGVRVLSLLVCRFHVLFQSLLPCPGALLRGTRFRIHLPPGKNRPRGEQADGENARGEFSSDGIVDGAILSFWQGGISDRRVHAKTSHYGGGSC